jgi:gamma-glutamylcyclotransferase (GGCT)/AIG2-like uncharacterized protein YtfP
VSSLRVFVYGSLKRGFSNHALLRPAAYLGEHVTQACYTMYDLGPYPAVSIGGRTPICGEVFSIDGQMLVALDELEDYPQVYDRVPVDTPYGSAWMYVMTPVSRPRVAGGCWHPAVGR